MLTEGVEQRTGLRALMWSALILGLVICRAPVFLVSPLLMKPVCLISQSRFKEPVYVVQITCTASRSKGHSVSALVTKQKTGLTPHSTIQIVA